jgi:uncharacterized protein YukE
MTRPAADSSSGSDVFQANTGDLLSDVPTFRAAGDAISSATHSLNGALLTAASSWDGEGQKQLNTLGNTFVKNLQILANAMDEISTRLQNSSLLIDSTETNNSNQFQHHQ